jgi:KUP system potassium uptake protein
MADQSPSKEPTDRRRLLALSLAALGIVYGDIGTSPLYAIRECFGEHHDLAVTGDNILGVLSLIFWSLLLVISLKYLVFILRADNRGEGGILALTALVTPLRVSAGGSRRVLLALGLFGAALLYGDGMITPAISVLSAVEGLRVATPVFQPYILPITIAILVALFGLQSHGTGNVGAIFGPVTLVWFLVLAVLGVRQILYEPAVLLALNPWYGIRFFVDNGWTGLLVLGSVFLVVTGGEALYADLGHFGARPIRLAWFCLVLPSLLLNYFGQGALLLRYPAAVSQPFYHMAPGWAIYPLVALATAATVIASQAIISGAFSLTMQAVQLGYCPRLTIQHTSSLERGQIYLPLVNWGLMAACIGLVLGFRYSGHLAAAYGVAVSTTMVITTVLFYFVATRIWHWPHWASLLLTGLFMVIDGAFFGANMLKIASGGWFPFAIAVLVFTLMSTWKRGRKMLLNQLRAEPVKIADFLEQIAMDEISPVPGTAIYMNSNPYGTPSALQHNLKHNKVLHERNIILTAVTEEAPHMPLDERLAAERLAPERLGPEFFAVKLRYGFMEEPDVPRDLSLLNLDGWRFRIEEATFFLGRENILPTSSRLFAKWRENLFIFMSRNARSATAFFKLPPNRVVELGVQVTLKPAGRRK